MRRLLGLLTAVAAVGIFAVPAAQATYAGKNGKLALTSRVGMEEGTRNVLLTTINPDGSGRVDLATDRSGMGRWSPDGSMLAFQSNLLVSCCHSDRNIEVMRADGSGRVLAFDGDFSVLATPRWSPGGRKLLYTREFRCGPGRAFTMNPDGSQLAQVSSGRFDCDDEEYWTSDGALGWLSDHRVAFVRFANESLGIYSVNEDGSDERLLLDLSAARISGDILLSPDGSRIAFVGNVSPPYTPGHSEAFAMSIDGTHRIQLTRQSDEYLSLISWSPDGKQLLAHEYSGLSWEPAALKRIHVDGSGSGTVTVMEDFGFSGAVWSPDSRQLAIGLRVGSGDTDIWTMDLDGSSRTDITNTPSISESVDDWQAIPPPKRSDYKNAAKFCKAERAFWGAQFASRYGGGANAYGKCVSGK